MQSRPPKTLGLLRVRDLESNIGGGGEHALVGADEKTQCGKLPVDKEATVLRLLEVGRVYWA